MGVLTAGLTVAALSIVPQSVSFAEGESTFQKYNGPESCIAVDSSGKVKAPGPGDCAQFGKEGQQYTNARAKNVILLIGDGFGQQEITAARNYLKGAGGRFEGIDAFPMTGFYTHHSINRKDGKINYVTDSAASATAWTTGVKTYNGAIGVALDGKPVENILEMAKKHGMRTGNVTTSEIQDATPAALSAHALNRKCYSPEENSDSCTGEAFDKQWRQNGGLGSISEQILDLRADVTLGGGSKYFNQKVQADGEGRNPYVENTMKWAKDKSVLDNAKDNGFQVVTNADELSKITAANQDKPLLGLFHEKNMTTRNAPSKAKRGAGLAAPASCTKQDTKGEPELLAMTEKALELLDDPKSEKGFFLQVESASIDKRAHAADACGMIGEVERFDEVAKAALDFAAKDGETLVIMTADHSHSSQIIYDNSESVSPVTRLKTADGSSMSVAYGTIPADVIENDPKSSTQHTGAQLRVAAYGPGAENVIGQIDQTDVHFVMTNALGITKGGDQHKAVLGELAKGAQAKDVPATCYEISADGSVVPGAGDCAQFGKEGQGRDKSKAKNVVLFIGDGTGDSELTSGRNYLYGASGRLPGIDNLPFTGSYTTYALNKKTGVPDLVTDSAASATGWSAGVKTYNGALSVNLKGEPVPTLLELAKKQGLKTGNITTAEIQDATPAAFATHALNRKCYGPDEKENSKSCQGEDFKGQYRENGGLGSISEQLVDSRADITMGGGSKAFGQSVKKGGTWGGHKWTEGQSVLDNAKAQGFQVVTTAEEFDKITEANQDKPVLGLFAEGNFPRNYTQTIPEVDGPKAPPVTCTNNAERPAAIPSLAAMTTKSMDLLKNDKGFLLQVEGASIDKADHDADICGQIGELNELDLAVQAAREWVKQNNEPTLLIMTADHAHTSQIVAPGMLTSGRATTLNTVEGSKMTVNYATAASNDDKEALGGQTHTGAQLRVAAEGPGAGNVVGQIDQTDVHFVVANALGLYGGDTKIDLTPQWDKPSQYPQSGVGSGNIMIWVLVGGIVVALVAALAIVGSRRKAGVTQGAAGVTANNDEE
ncbi:alkaline phosphatase [Arcanobacterium hippocoleae]